MSIEAMKQALEAMEAIRSEKMFFTAQIIARNARYSLRQAIEQAEKQEPVCDKDPHLCWSVRCQLGKVCKNTAPPKREWVGLDENDFEYQPPQTVLTMKFAEAILRDRNK